MGTQLSNNVNCTFIGHCNFKYRVTYNLKKISVLTLEGEAYFEVNDNVLYLFLHTLITEINISLTAKGTVYG